MDMQRHKLFYSLVVAFGVLLALVLAVGSVAARGQGAATRFEAIDVACGTFDGDGDLNFAGVTLSDEPRIAGRSEVEITFVGQQVLVDATFFPDAFDGTWIAPGHSTDTPAPAVHKGYGTGELAGQKIMLTARVIDAAEVDTLPCTPVGPVVKLAGTIFE